MTRISATRFGGMNAPMGEPMQSEKKSNHAGERGQVLLEFALAATLYITLFVGIAEGAQLLLRFHQLTQAAREGARIASFTPNMTQASVQNNVKTKIIDVLNNMNVPEGSSSAPNFTIDFSLVDVSVPVDNVPDLIDVTLSQSVANIIGVPFISYFRSTVLSTTVSMPLLAKNTSPGP